MLLLTTLPLFHGNDYTKDYAGHGQVHKSRASRRLVNHQVSPSTLERYSLHLIAKQSYDLVIEPGPGPAATRVPGNRERELGGKERLEPATRHGVDPIRRSIETIADLRRLRGQRRSKVPVAQPEHGIGFKPMIVQQAIANLGRKDVLVNLRFYRCHVVGDWNPLVVLQSDPHEVYGDDDPVVTSLYRAHQSKIEVGQNVASRDMNAAFVVKRSHRPIDTGEPQIRDNVYVPTLIGGIRCISPFLRSYRTLRLRGRNV